MNRPAPAPTPTARSLAVQALVRVEEGAYANLVVPPMLARSHLDDRDRHFVTQLVYGITRMRRACDWLLAPHVRRALEPEVTAALRLGAYQLVFLGTPPHAAVSATVDASPRRARSLVNAVLRRVAEAGPPEWPDLATELSYPDWIVTRLQRELGEEQAEHALHAMNEPVPPTVRPDGYVQDPASQWVAELVEPDPGDIVVDLCAGPGGKATWMAPRARLVVAGDAREGRANLVAANAAKTGAAAVAPVVMDATRPALRPGRAPRVLVDAPCSGLGVLGRRPDARWRISERDVDDLARLQRRLVAEAVDLVAPGGVLAYSVCTLTAIETVELDAWLGQHHPDLVALPAPGDPWEPVGRGSRLLPQTAGTDGMYLLRLSRP